MKTKSKTSVFYLYQASFQAIVLLYVLTLSACANTSSSTSTETSPTQTTAPQPHNRQYQTLPKGSLEQILLAELALRRQALTQALPLLAAQTAITESPSLAMTTAKLADYLGETSISEAATEIWLQHRPHDKDAHEILVKNLIAQGDYVHAFEQIRRENNPHEIAQLIQLVSNVIRSNNKASKALVKAMYTKAYDNHKNNAGILVGLGLLTELDKEASALPLLQRANKLAPSDPMIANIKAAVETDSGHHTDALDTLERALSYQPDHYGLQRHRAGILVNIDPAAAYEAFQQLYELSPNDAKVVQPLAQLAIKHKDFELAETLLSTLAYDPNFSDFAYYSLGAISEHKERPFSAMKFYGEVVAEPYIFAALRRFEQLANTYDSLEEFEAHLVRLKSQADDSAYIDLSVHHTEFLLRNNNANKANTILTDALDTFPDDNKLLYSYFLVQQTLGNYQQAIKPLEVMVLRYPNNPTLLNALGYTLSRYLGEHERAAPLIASALALSPKDPAIMDSMGWIKLQQGEINEALGYFASAYKMSENIDIAVHLAEVLWLKDQQSEALALLQKIWQQDANNIELLDTLQRLNIQLQ